MTDHAPYKRLTSRRTMIGGALAATAGAVAIALPSRAFGENYPDTKVQGIDVSGLSREDTILLMRNAFQPLEAHAITFSFEDKTWQASLDHLGVTIDYNAMADQAYKHGRGMNPFQRYATLVSQGSDRDVPIAFSTNMETLDAFLTAIDQEIRIEPVNAQLARRGNDIDIRQERIGRTLDLEHARQASTNAVATGRTTTVALRTVDVQPNLYAAQLEAAREEAAVLITDPLVFTYEDITYDFDTNELAGAITIASDGSATLDLAKLESRMTQIAEDMLVAPINVKLGWDSGLYVVEDDVDGLGVNMDEFGKRILAAAVSTDQRTVELPTEVLKARARTDNVDELGITENISYGSSLYTGSNETRAANVIVSANNISYKMVGPGETFSFSEQMGPISVENGFLEGKIIQGDWIASDLGGGVCQVSTTVFRAAFTAGFRFSEWNHHGWRLPFYESDGSPPGLDAAIYQPNSEWEEDAEKDLKFINPLDSWLLLMMVTDSEAVTAYLYGKPNGWTVEVGEAQISDPIKPGEPVVKENPELAKGERKRVGVAENGYDVSIRRTVKDADGNIVSDGDFISNYRSKPETWEVGPS